MTTLIDLDAAGAAPAPPRATRREWIGLAVIALPCLLYAMDLSVLNLAVPHLAADLKPTSTQLLWIVDIYGFLVAGSLITMGTLGDRIGRRRLLLIGAAFFGAASIFAAFSTSPEMLIVARAILGIAAATLAPSTLSLIRNMFLDPKQRTIAIGVWISSFSAGGAFGPLIGGAILSVWWWGAVFLINVPIMLLLLALGPKLLPEYRDPAAGRLDIVSAALSLFAVLGIIYGIKEIAAYGLGGIAVAAIAAGLFFGLAFVRRQRRLADPMIDLALFRNPAFTASLATNVFAFFVAFGTFLLVAQYMQLVLGMTPLEAGLWTAPSGIAFIVGSNLAPRLLGRVRPAYVVAGGLATAALGFLILSQGSLPFLVGGYVVMSLGLAPVFTLTTDLVVSAAPPERAGSAAAMAETSSELGGALGIALLGSLVTAAYRSTMQHLPAGGIAPDMLATARDTLAGALEVAAALPAAVGETLASLARQGYAEGFTVSAWLSAAIVFAVALAVATLLRKVEAPAPG